MRSRAALTEVEADIQTLVSVPQYVHRLLVPSGVSMLSSMLEARGQDLWGCPRALFRFFLPVLSVAVVISQSISPLLGEFCFEDAMNWQVIPVFRKLLEG